MLKPRLSRAELRIVLIYALLGGVWILASDRLLLVLTHDPAEITRLATLKGWAYVLLSAVLLFALLEQTAAARLRADTAMRESERRFRTVFDSSPIGAAVVALDGRFQRVNLEFCRIMGSPPAELLGRTYQEITHPDDRVRDERQVQRLLGGEIDRYVTDKRYVRADGTVVWAHLSLNLIRDGAGRAQDFLTMVEDISDRVRAEAELARERAFTEALLDSVPGLFFLYDREGRLRRWSRSAETVLGFTVEDLRGKHVLSWFEGEDRARVADAVERVFREGRVEIEAILVTAGGARLPYYFSAVSLQVGDATYFTGIGIDVTDLRRAEAAVRESERSYREIFEAVDDAIIVLDADTGAILDVNDAVRRLFGYEREQTMRASLDATLPAAGPYSGAAAREWMAKAVREGPQRFEWQGRRKGGEQFWTEIALKSAELNGRRRILALVRDIGERKRAEEALQRHRQTLAGAGRALALGELSTAMAHELNQPLAAILSNAQAARRLLDQQPADVREVRQALADIERDDRRAGEVIQRLRDFVRRQAPRRARVDLNRTAREVLLMVQGQALRHGVMTVARLDSALAPVIGDPVALQQAVMNLVTNALDAVQLSPPTEREIIVITRHDDAGLVELTVRDTGPGVAPELLDKVFEPFYTTKPDGLGLGLPLTRSLVEAEGGEAWAVGNTEGGMTFGIRLPAAGGGVR